MKLAKNVVSTALVVFMVMTITSVEIVLPVSAESVVLLDAYPKWRALRLSQHPNQILYAKVKNTRTEDVYVKVRFELVDPSSDEYAVETDIVFLPSHRAIKLKFILTDLYPGVLSVTVILYYSADGINWLADGIKTFTFLVVP